MSEMHNPDDEVPTDADEFLAELCARVPALAGDLSAMLAPGAGIDFGPISERLESLSATDRAICEQMFASFMNGAIRSRVAERATHATDDAILEAALDTSMVNIGTVAVEVDIIPALQVLSEAGRALTAAADPDAVRVLLVAGYARVLLDFDHSTLVHDIDELSRQVAVTAAAHEFIAPIESVAMALTEVFTQHPDIEVQLDLGVLNDRTDASFARLLAYFPDVVTHFDELLAARVAAEADHL